MTPSSLIASLARQNIRLWAQDGQLHFDAPKGAVTKDVLAQLRQNKSGVLKCLTERPAVEPDADPDNPEAIRQMEARRQEILKMMADDDQGRKYHYFTDIESDPDYVILAVGIRGVATFEMKMPREKYDPFLLLETIGKEH